KKDTDKLYFTTENGVILELTILRDSELRFRYATEHVFEPDFSYAISEDVILGFNHLEVADQTDHYLVKTSKLKVYINKPDLKVRIADLDDNIINQDELGFHWE